MGEHDFIHLIQNVWNISVEYKISGGDPHTPSHPKIFLDLLELRRETVLPLAPDSKIKFTN